MSLEVMETSNIDDGSFYFYDDGQTCELASVTLDLFHFVSGWVSATRL